MNHPLHRHASSRNDNQRHMTISTSSRYGRNDELALDSDEKTPPKSTKKKSSFLKSKKLDRNDGNHEATTTTTAFPITRRTYLYAFCAALNSVNLGYDLGVSTNAGPLIQQDFDLSTQELEAFLGSLNLWSMVGAVMSPFLSDHFGRVTTLQIAAIGFIVGVSVCTIAMSFSTLMMGRMILGVAVGIGEALDPMYISEIAPAHVRGELVSWAEAGVAVGVVLGFTSGLLGSSVDSVGWRFMLGLGGFLPLIMLVLTQFVLPESPRWLTANGNEAAARIILGNIYPTTEMVESVVNEMKDSIDLEERAQNTVGWMALLRPTPSIRRMLIVGVGIAIIQQAVGIDSIMFYLMFVLQQAGVKTDMGQNLALIGLGVVKLLFVFVGARNFDHSGRRPMLFLSLGGMAASLLVVAFTFTDTNSDIMKIMTVVALAVYLAFFSIGVGPGNWVVVSEIFAPSIRAKAMMLAVLPNRLTATIMASTFLSVANVLTWPGFFLLLSGICLVSMAFLFLYLPETKGKSLEDMVGYFAQITGDSTVLELEAQLRQQQKEERSSDDGVFEEGHDTKDDDGVDDDEEENIYGSVELQIQQPTLIHPTVPIT